MTGVRQLVLMVIAVVWVGDGWALAKPQGTTTSGQIFPNTGNPGPAPTLTPEELELLIRLTEIEDPKAAGSPSTINGEANLVAEAFQTALKIERLEQVLRTSSRIQSEEMSRLLLKLLATPERHLRITALHWLATRKDMAVVALATALRDSDNLVQSVAAQILLDYGITERVVDDLRAEARRKDDATIQIILRSLLKSPQN